MKIIFNHVNHDRYFARHQSNYEKRHFVENNLFSKRDKVLRIHNIMMFDSNKHIVNFFIRRFQQIANIEKIKLIFRILFLCFEKIF